MTVLLVLAAIVLAIGLVAVLASNPGRRFLQNLIDPPDEPLDPDEPVAILRNLYETEAEMMCERLKSEGIPSFVRGLRPDPLFGRINADLCVPSRDADRALSLLTDNEDASDPTSVV